MVLSSLLIGCVCETRILFQQFCRLVAAPASQLDVFQIQSRFRWEPILWFYLLVSLVLPMICFCVVFLRSPPVAGWNGLRSS